MPPIITGPTDIDLHTTPLQRLEILWTTVSDATTDPKVRRWVQTLLSQSVRAQSGETIDVAWTRMLLATVQRLPNRPEPPGREIFQPVALTLAAGGDCDDHAAAFCAGVETARILWPHPSGTVGGYGMESELYWMPLAPVWPLNHVTSRVRKNGGPWLWAESYVPGARLGEEPIAAAKRLGQLESIRGSATTSALEVARGH